MPTPRTATVPAFAIALLLPLAAVAQGSPPATSLRWFDGFDQNRDGYVTAVEANAAGATEFARIDKDRSGGITVTEYLADIAPEDAGKDDVIRQTRNRFAVLDQRGDGNGTASRTEFTDFTKFVLELSDQNGDNDERMSRQEFIDSVTPEQ